MDQDANPIPTLSPTQRFGPSLDGDPPSALAQRRTPAALSTSERVVVGVFSLLQSAVFGWACVLPWDKASLFVALCSVLCASHGVAGATCLLPRARPNVRLWTWFTASAASCVYLVWTTWAAVTSAVYLSKLYGGLGQGFGAVLMALWALGGLVTLPMLVWATYRTWGLWRFFSARTGAVVGLGLAGLVGLGALGAADAAASEQRTPTSEETRWLELLQAQVVPLVKARGTLPPSGPLSHRPASLCSRPVGPGRDLTTFVHYLEGAGKTRARCVQGETLEIVAGRVAALLQQEHVDGPVSLDRLTSVRVLHTTPRWLFSLSLRPGVDGACFGEKCLTPWQLIAQSRFVTHAPLSFLGDLKFGIALVDVTKALSSKADREQWQQARESTAAEALVAFTSQHTVISVAGELTPLVRLHPEKRPVTREQIDEAALGFEKHILAAQQKNGQFRYTLDPFTGKAETRELNLARQAGTLLALCEVGSLSQAVDDAARRGLELLLEKRRKADEMWALSLSTKDRYVRLGDSALPLVAMLTCRARVGPGFDDAIARLSQYLLRSQRPDGSFATDYDWKKQRAVDRGEALYAPGQALLALTLLDTLVVEHPELQHLGSSATLTEAIQRGMNHVALTHWDIPLEPFFFVEENWNCLTARAALRRQRNDAYERFCLDYMRFKARLIFTAESNVSPEFVGGFGFGNVIPPHNTGAAGFGEALSAAIVVKRARSQTVTDDERLLREVLGFLLRQQWTEGSCPMCVSEALGSMSEHLHSPMTRIDFAQHAWAAVAHGGVVLGLRDGSS